MRPETLSDETLYWTLGRFAQVLLARSMVLSACNLFHPVDHRSIRWLLTISDLFNDGEIPLTHELMATILGIRRTTVAVVLRSLRKAGLVHESRRGLVLIRDRRSLEKASCECYRVMRHEQRRLLGY